jgi:hypothetical protein
MCHSFDNGEPHPRPIGVCLGERPLHPCGGILETLGQVLGTDDQPNTGLILRRAVRSPLAPDVAIMPGELRDNFSRGLGWLIAGALQGG